MIRKLSGALGGALNDLIDGCRGRKAALAFLVTVLSFVGLMTDKLGGGEFVAVVTLAGAILGASNVAAKKVSQPMVGD